MDKLKRRPSNDIEREAILDDVKEYIRLAPRHHIVNKATREYTNLLYRDISTIFKKHGINIKAKFAIAEYMDKNFILRT